MEIKKPIFFIGMPRSGTTIIFEAFSSHKNLGWLSNYSNRFPGIPYFTLAHRLFGGAQGRKNQHQKIRFYERILPEPQEVYNVWERFFGRKFLKTFLINCEPSEHEINACREYIKKVLWAENKLRFCAKFSGNLLYCPVFLACTKSFKAIMLYFDFNTLKCFSAVSAFIS